MTGRQKEIFVLLDRDCGRIFALEYLEAIDNYDTIKVWKSANNDGEFSTEAWETLMSDLELEDIYEKLW